jgi:5-methylcytosine-specific restriction endonuclease McrA
MSKSTIQQLTEQLFDLRQRYEAYAFTRAILAVKRKKPGMEVREKRKKFPWSVYCRLYEHQRGVCPLCQQVMVLLRGEVVIDHRDPTRADFNAVENLQLTHRACNRAKSATTPYEDAKARGNTILAFVRSDDSPTR